MPNTHIEHRIQVEGHSIVAWEYNTHIKGTPLIFIHGITSSVGYWETVHLPIVEQQFHWFSLSLPGHYPAAFPENFNDMDFTAALIARLLTTAIHQLVGNQKVILIGHSTGGFAALNVAANAPELVESVISISGFAHGTWTGGLGVFQKLVRMGPAGKRVYQLQYTLLKIHWRVLWSMMWPYPARIRAMYRVPNFAADIKALFPLFRKLNLTSMVICFRRFPDIDITEQISQISVPILLIVGDKDPIVPPTQSQIIASKVQHAKLVVLANVGHLPMLEDAAAFQTAMIDWLLPYAQSQAAAEQFSVPEAP